MSHYTDIELHANAIEIHGDSLIADIPGGIQLIDNRIQSPAGNALLSDSFTIGSMYSKENLTVSRDELKDLASILVAYFGRELNEFVEVDEYVYHLSGENPNPAVQP